MAVKTELRKRNREKMLGEKNSEENSWEKWNLREKERTTRGKVKTETVKTLRRKREEENH